MMYNKKKNPWKIIEIKSKQKISDLNIKEIKNNFDDTKTFSGLKIKCEYNNLQEEFLDLFKLLQENLSYFLLSNSKMKFKNLLTTGKGNIKTNHLSTFCKFVPWLPTVASQQLQLNKQLCQNITIKPTNATTVIQ